jgi:CheY-like chemotaxis protein
MVDNGEEAVAAASRKAYEIIFMDVRMPGIDGLEATRRIRAALPPGPPGPRIVAVTANAFDEDRVRCIDAGMDDFLPKPVVPEEFCATLFHWLHPS